MAGGQGSAPPYRNRSAARRFCQHCASSRGASCARVRDQIFSGSVNCEQTYLRRRIQIVLQTVLGRKTTQVSQGVPFTAANCATQMSAEHAGGDELREKAIRVPPDLKREQGVRLARAEADSGLRFQSQSSPASAWRAPGKAAYGREFFIRSGRPRSFLEDPGGGAARNRERARRHPAQYRERLCKRLRPAP